MALNKLQKKAAEKVELYKSLLKVGQPKKVALKEVRKQFKSGLDSGTCSSVARKLGISNGEMKSRAIQHNLSLKTEVKAELRKTPVVQELSMSPAISEELAAVIRERMKDAKGSKTMKPRVIILDKAELKLALAAQVAAAESTQRMLSVMEPVAIAKIRIDGDVVTITQEAREFSAKL
jgi:hypothetical protein